MKKSVLYAALLAGVAFLGSAHAGDPPAAPAAAPDAIKAQQAQIAKQQAEIDALVKQFAAQNAGNPQPLPKGPQNVVTAKLKDGRTVKLGRIKPAFPNPNVPKFKKYFSLPANVAPPDVVDYAPKAMPSINRMYLNDTLGCCVISGKMHQIGLFSGNDSDSGGIVLATDAEVRSQYTGICGPGDNGCVITDVLDVWKTKGLTAGGKSYKIDGYVQIDSTNKLELQVAIDLFGSVTFGIDLPSAWLNTNDGELWDVTNTRIVGGHDVPAVGYNAQGVVIATWSGRRTITWAALSSNKWITETYAALAPLWYGNDRLAPSGVDVTALQADLAALGGGTIPPIGPATVTIPNVVGKLFADAKGICALAGLSCNLAAGSDPAKPIASQAPAAGVQAAAGSTVTVTTAGVPIPPVTGPVARVDLYDSKGKLIQSFKSSGGLSDADTATLKAAGDVITRLIGGDPLPPEAAPPAGFTSDERLPVKLAEVLRANGHPLLARRMERESLAHPLMAKRIFQRMAKDEAGQKLLSEYQPDQALPPGWLMAWAEWLLKNLPAILAIILPLFGGACVMPFGFARIRRLHREVRL